MPISAAAIPGAVSSRDRLLRGWSSRAAAGGGPELRKRLREGRNPPADERARRAGQALVADLRRRRIAGLQRSGRHHCRTHHSGTFISPDP